MEANFFLYCGENSFANFDTFYLYNRKLVTSLEWTYGHTRIDNYRVAALPII